MSDLPKPKETKTEAGKAVRQTYLEVSRRVIGEPEIDYTELYQRFTQNDWAAIKLDDSVALAALKSGKPAKEVCLMLLQGPYVQHQVHVKQVATMTMTRYAKSTVREAMGQLQGRQRVVPVQKHTESEMER
ncbi:hypothetical protein [Leptothoe spongobia]|uniref:Uncharacterized protein n=1 Tax=Leptothoe spongobia TAU-MAC 1115 TaxID=1967444 RepID=A0A947GSC7_9CYAN|nr:hypothetical protein [Leptothoe spongobia]MBT9317891.1 hypothetical protein [Leptothoe spongobia TAU-MAC 1115]